MNNIEEIATSFAREYGNDAIYPSHLFKAILHKDIGMVHFIETDLDKDYYYLQEWADVQMQLSPKTARPVRDPHYSQEAEAVMEEAENYQMKLGLATCEPVCILASLATPGVGFSLDQLKTLPLTVSEIMAKVEGTAHRDGKEKGESSATRATTATDNGMIRKYCIDKRQEMESGNVPPVIGFDMADERQLSYEERAALRQRLAGPLLDAFELWLQNTYPKVLKRSLMGKAIAYAYPLIPRMRHYLYDGRIFIDNNRAENALRPMVLTRKNMLFCGNQQAAENTAVICSLLDSCKECGVNPREWLNDVISKLPYYLTPKSEKKLTELLPDRWGGYRQSHDTLPTVPGMSMDNPRTVHRQTVHAT